MLDRTASVRLTTRERARRAARGGASRSVPAPLLVPALIAVAFLVLPLAGLLIRAPWGSLGNALSGSDATQALVLSVWTASASTAISLVIGTPLAWVLARTSFPGQRLLRALVTLPLVLPPVVGGVALLLAFSRVGLLGRYLNHWFGLTIPFTPLAVVMAETFVAMPFLIITVEGALRSADQGFEEAAATLGARRMTVFRRVTVPLIAPVLGAGPGRVRRDDHLRRQLPRPDRDHADRRVLRARDRPRRRDRAQPGAAARLRPRAGLPARPLTARRLTLMTNGGGDGLVFDAEVRRG